jgi:hypothetical protein
MLSMDTRAVAAAEAVCLKPRWPPLAGYDVLEVGLSPREALSCILHVYTGELQVAVINRKTNRSTAY